MGPIASKQQAWQTRRQFRRADKALFDEFQAFQKSIALSHWWMQEFANLTGGLRFHGAATSDYGNCGSQAFSARNRTDRKSTRLNSSHQIISYAVFCLKKKKHEQHRSTVKIVG